MTRNPAPVLVSAAPWHTDPFKHPAYVSRATLPRPLKNNGWVRIRSAGAKIMSSTAIACVQAANVPHSYTSKLANDILVPTWVAVIFGAMKGMRREQLTSALKLYVGQDDNARAALTAVWRTAGLQGARALLRHDGVTIPASVPR